MPPKYLLKKPFTNFLSHRLRYKRNLIDRKSRLESFQRIRDFYEFLQSFNSVIEFFFNKANRPTYRYNRTDIDVFSFSLLTNQG